MLGVIGTVAWVPFVSLKLGSMLVEEEPLLGSELVLLTEGLMVLDTLVLGAMVETLLESLFPCDPAMLGGGVASWLDVGGSLGLWIVTPW